VLATDPTLPDWLAGTLAALGLDCSVVGTGDAAVDECRRGRPDVLVLDARGGGYAATVRVIAALKADAYTAVVPSVGLCDDGRSAAILDAGADEAIGSGVDPAEAAARLAAAVRRSVRDLAAQPTTRLPAASEIEREIERRIAASTPFAACYADLDHFKEFNDRYGYREGDRVIRMVARLLHDVAVGRAGADAFVGHIGGDDFMLVVPLAEAVTVCELALEVFDTFVPYQYAEADRRAGYYFGKDRRGQLHRVPLMSLSIGVATTGRRRFTSAAQVSKLASEMKTFAKTRPGSVYAVDRRGSDEPAGRGDGTAAVTTSAEPHPTPLTATGRERHVR
jgi:diguanylate cyclase (GGDEF)-like protein